MENFYKKYIDKELLINQACDCIDANNSSKLQEEINQIKNTIANLSLYDVWQDKAGVSFKKMIDSCVDTLNILEESIASDFKTSEEIYKLIKSKLQQLKETNELFSVQYLKKPLQSSYQKKIKQVADDVSTFVYKNDYTAYKNAYDSWEHEVDMLKTKCIDLSSEIDNYFKQLNEIDGINVLSSFDYSLPKFNNSINGFVKMVNNVGKFIIDNSSNYKYGTFFSGIDGKKHTIYNQGKIKGWKGFCNRAAAASIASGYENGGLDAITEVNETSKINNQIGYDNDATNHYFSKFGLSASVNKVNCSYDLVRDKILSSLKEGNLIMFDLSESNVKGKSGQQWTDDRHWVSILDLKKTGPGDNDYAIFISDSAHEGSIVNHGLGDGWYSIDEFNGKNIANITTVKPINTNSTSQTTINSLNTTMNVSQTISGTEAEAAIYKAAKDMGYNDAVAAAMISNADAESSFNSTLLDSKESSYGLFQWHNDRREAVKNYCEENGVSASDPYYQAKYALIEMETNPRFSNLKEVLNNVPDTPDGYMDASKAWTIEFEVPTNKYQKAEYRSNEGLKYYDNIKNL